MHQLNLFTVHTVTQPVGLSARVLARPTLLKFPSHSLEVVQSGTPAGLDKAGR